MSTICKQMLTTTMFVYLNYSFYICNQIVNKMNTRLQQFLGAENISQSQFADSIGVARASVSHILAGRNRPGFDFIESMAKRYPTLNLEWLITGKGKMYKADLVPAAPVPAPTAETEEQSLFSEPEPRPETPKTERFALSKSTQRANKQRSISRIIVFYDDNSFEELK